MGCEVGLCGMVCRSGWAGPAFVAVVALYFLLLLFHVVIIRIFVIVVVIIVVVVTKDMPPVSRCGA